MPTPTSSICDVSVAKLCVQVKHAREIVELLTTIVKLSLTTFLLK